MKVIFHCSNFQYFGTGTNCSATGMCIYTKLSLSSHVDIEIVIPLRGKRLNLKAAIKRVANEECFYDTLGVELLNPPQLYLSYLCTLRIGYGNHSFLKSLFVHNFSKFYPELSPSGSVYNQAALKLVFNQVGNKLQAK